MKFNFHINVKYISRILQVLIDISSNVSYNVHSSPIDTHVVVYVVCKKSTKFNFYSFDKMCTSQ